jgi:hypothetical protein
MIKQKLQAALIHLGISALVVGCFLAFVLTVWYPAPFFDLLNLQHIILMLIAVDVLLGPLLTLLVFKPQKATLKFDLSTIATLQIAALTYGMYAIYQSHPLYVAYAGDRFLPINASQISPSEAKYDELKKSKLTGFTPVYVKTPTDSTEIARLTKEVSSGAPDLYARPAYYEPFDKFTQEAFAQGMKPEKLLANPEYKQKLEQFLAKYGKTANDYAFLPLVGQEDAVLWAWSRETGKPVGTLAINPWKPDQVATAK